MHHELQFQFWPPTFHRIDPASVASIGVGFAPSIASPDAAKHLSPARVGRPDRGSFAESSFAASDRVAFGRYATLGVSWFSLR